MNVRKSYRRIICVLLLLSMIALGWCTVEAIRNEIPDSIQVSGAYEVPQIFSNGLDRIVTAEYVEPQEQSTSGVRSDRTISGQPDGTAHMQEERGQHAVQLPQDGAAQASGTGLSEEARAVSAERAQGYTLSYRLFGAIPLKMVSVSVVPRSRLYAGGSPIGIYLETDGVLVVDTGNIVSADGRSCCPAEDIVRSGDYIQSVNGETVTTKEELISCIAKSKGLDVVLDVERAGEQISLRLQPVLDEKGTYRAGIWVRNDTQGIGTLTYMEEDGSFGALGHGISDIDTGELLDVCGGTLYDADVISVIRGQQGVPGELSGVIHYNEGYKIGNIEKNSSNGIFGKVSNLPALIQDKESYLTAHKQEVQTGKATILCCVGGERESYEIEIREIRLNGSNENKGMILEVTDEALLDQTGGIVQGMSGSPIIQDGRLVGAVTHVFVNDPIKGYGIFIEDMLEHDTDC